MRPEEHTILLREIDALAYDLVVSLLYRKICQIIDSPISKATGLPIKTDSRDHLRLLQAWP